MDDENNGKPYEQMDDLGVFPYFWKHPTQIFFWSIYNDLSRRLVTPNGALVRESPPNPLISGLGIIVIYPDFYVRPYLGKSNPIWLAHIFQKGWNHQLANYFEVLSTELCHNGYSTPNKKSGGDLL